MNEEPTVPCASPFPLEKKDVICLLGLNVPTENVTNCKTRQWYAKRGTFIVIISEYCGEFRVAVSINGMAAQCPGAFKTLELACEASKTITHHAAAHAVEVAKSILDWTQNK